MSEAVELFDTPEQALAAYMKKMFQSWVAPRTTIEALERCHDFAKQEQQWMTGEFVNGEIEDVYNEETDGEKYRCTNVSACAVGIVGLVLIDGEMIRYSQLNFSPDEQLDDLLANHPIGKEVLHYMARAAYRLAKKDYDKEAKKKQKWGNNCDCDECKKERSMDDAKIVISYNDEPKRGYGPKGGAYNKDLHHASIVQMFATAILIWHERNTQPPEPIAA